MLYSPFSSIDDCAKICDGLNHCKAIEWSPSELKCVLINTPTTNGPNFLDYQFCGKGLYEILNIYLPKYLPVFLYDIKISLYKSIIFIVNCIEENSRCLKRKQRGIDGPSCSRVYSQCVANATSSNRSQEIASPWFFLILLNVIEESLK